MIQRTPGRSWYPLLSHYGKYRTERSELTIFQITRNEANMLRDKGYDEFVHISSKTHKSRSKRYWLVEDRRVLQCLYRYRSDEINMEGGQGHRKIKIKI